MSKAPRRGMKKLGWLLGRLKDYDCEIIKKRGKGSHFLIKRPDPAGGRTLTFVLPRHREYGPDYLKPLRSHLKLRPEDGVSDEDFYSA